MPVTTRQLLRLIHVIEQRFDLTNREKEELLSILDDPSEADEALESGYTRQGLSPSPPSIRKYNRKTSTPQPVAQPLAYKLRLGSPCSADSRRVSAMIRATVPTHS